MRILFCSDGSIQAENALRFGSLITRACQAEATILGISENKEDETGLLEALARGQQLLHDKASNVEITCKTGEPVQEILQRTLESNYDLVVVGAVRKGTSGAFWMSGKAYKIIKSITPPVLIVIGSRTRLQQILVCSGGRNYIDKALELTGQIARGAGARVTLAHVMVEPPRMYADLLAREKNLERLLKSSSPVGHNLKREKEALESMGVATEVQLLHGEVMPELRSEMRRVDYDLVVAGATPGRGPLQTYIMGDVTRELVNQANCPVLVVRTGQNSSLPEGLNRFLTEIKQAFGREKEGP